MNNIQQNKISEKLETIITLFIDLFSSNNIKFMKRIFLIAIIVVF